MFKVSPASHQTFIDTPNCVLEDRVQYSTVHIPNVFWDETVYNTVFVCFFDTVIVRCTETFDHPVQRNIPASLELHRKVSVEKIVMFYCYNT